MLIRPLVPADAHAYTAVRREALTDSPWAFSASPEDDLALDPAHIAKRLTESGFAIIGAFEEDGRLLGMAALMLNHRKKLAHRAHIWGVYVSPAARGRGLGETVMRKTLEIARGWPGVTSVSLSASVRSTRAISLYARLGFVPWGTEPGCLVLNGEAIDEIHMVAFLNGTTDQAE